MDYIVKGILTLILLIVFLCVTIVSVPASISTSIDGNIMLTILLLLSCGVVIFGWKLSGKIVESDLYDDFQAEIIYTPNNAQLKAIMLPSLIICVCSFAISYLPKTDEEFLTEIRDFLPKDGKFIFGYPNLEFFFSNKHTNAINFEHTMLMTDFYVDYFMLPFFLISN